MTANAEIILEERKGVLAIPEGAILYKKDKSTEVEIPDAASGEAAGAASPWSRASATARRPRSSRGFSEGQQVILQ